MDRLALYLHVALLACVLFAAWRLWALERQVERSRREAAQARSEASQGRRAAGTAPPVKVYAVEIRAEAAASAVRVLPAKEPGAQVSTAVPLVMARSPMSLALADDVASGAVRYLVADSTVFRAAPFGAFTQRPSEKAFASEPADAVVWLVPVPNEQAGSFPFPGVKTAASLALNADGRGLARAFVVGA
jgi:hypothetical protein